MIRADYISNDFSLLLEKEKTFLEYCKKHYKKIEIIYFIQEDNKFKLKIKIYE